MPRADARHPRCPRPRRSWRMRCAVVALLAALTWPAAASAQGNDVGEASGEPTQTVDGSGAADATAPAGPPVNDGTLRPPALDRNALSVRWTSWRLAASASAADSEAWADFETAAAELGATELPAHGLALVRGAVAAREAGQATRAAQLLERARSLAPRSPLPDFLAARWRVDDDVLGFAAAPGRALAGWDRLALTMDGRRALAVAGWSAVFAAICGLIVSLVAPIFARRMPQAAFDVRLLLLRIPTLWQAGVIVALAVAAPAALLWSPAALVGAMILVAAPWARLGERAVLALACGLAVPLPWVAEQQALALATAESRAPLHAMATAGWCDARCESELAAQADAGDPGAAIALAAVQFRVGSSERLRRAHALLDGTRPPPELAVAHGALLGNLAYVEGDIDGAERAWRGAIEQARTPAQRAAAAWNLAQLYSRMQLADSERDALLIADGADPLLIDRMTGYRGRSLNRVLLAVPLDEIALYRAALAATDPDVVAAIAAERLDPVLGSGSSHGSCSPGPCAACASRRCAAATAAPRPAVGSTPRRSSMAAACSATSSTRFPSTSPSRNVTRGNGASRAARSDDASRRWCLVSPGPASPCSRAEPPSPAPRSRQPPPPGPRSGARHPYPRRSRSRSSRGSCGMA